MEALAKPAIEAVLKAEEIKLFPKKFENTYRHWMETSAIGIFPGNCGGDNRFRHIITGKGRKILSWRKRAGTGAGQGKDGNTSLDVSGLRQDPDVLDTWFSSWLWPISVFGGILDPENEEIKYYYPTNDLVTGPDILFFWVARMIMSGYEYRNEKPFTNVYLTGLVRDSQRRKMSKSLGNSPDALKLISDYGADGVRVGLLLSSAAGNDLLFDEGLCQQGKDLRIKYGMLSVWSADGRFLRPNQLRRSLR